MRIFILRLMAVLILAPPIACFAQGELPYRFLLVISDQWKDDSSQLLSSSPTTFRCWRRCSKPGACRSTSCGWTNSGWTRYHLLDREGRPLYGTIIWDAGELKVKGKDLELVEGPGAPGRVRSWCSATRWRAPEIAAGRGALRERVHVRRRARILARSLHHSRAAQAARKELMAGVGYSLGGSKVEAAESATVLGARGAVPFLTVREVPSGGARRLAGRRAQCSANCRTSSSGTC